MKGIIHSTFEDFSSFTIWSPDSPAPLLLTEDLLPPGFPNIDMGPQLKVVERTRTATMLCAASGNPDPEITWYKDFLPIDPSASNGRIKQLRSGKESSSLFFLVTLTSRLPSFPFHRVNGVNAAAAVYTDVAFDCQEFKLSFCSW